MTNASAFSSASISSISNLEVSGETELQFTISCPGTVESGDVILLTVPSEIGITTITCGTLACSEISSKVISITLDSNVNSETPFIFTVGGLINPNSGSPSSSFELTLQDANGYLMNEYYGSSLTVTATGPFVITDFSNYPASITSTVPYSGI